MLKVIKCPTIIYPALIFLRVLCVPLKLFLKTYIPSKKTTYKLALKSPIKRCILLETFKIDFKILVIFVKI